MGRLAQILDDLELCKNGEPLWEGFIDNNCRYYEYVRVRVVRGVFQIKK